MSRIVFVMVFAAILVRCAQTWRRVVGVTLIAAISVGMIFPAPVYAQFGFIGGILNIINGGIQTVLNTISAVSRSLEELQQEIVWPVPLINRAKTVVASLISQFRGIMNSIYRMPVGSATLPIPSGLDAIIRNRQTNDFPNLSRSYYQAFGDLPAADRADPLARNMIDVDDSLALNTLKTSKATDQVGDQILDSGNQIEDEARLAAPGSAPFLTAAAMASNIQSQAMTQRMLAAMLRQEAARMAHENAVRKRYGILAVRVRESLSDLLQRP